MPAGVVPDKLISVKLSSGGTATVVLPAGVVPGKDIRFRVPVSSVIPAPPPPGPTEEFFSSPLGEGLWYGFLLLCVVQYWRSQLKPSGQKMPATPVSVSTPGSAGGAQKSAALEKMSSKSKATPTMLEQGVPLIRPAVNTYNPDDDKKVCCCFPSRNERRACGRTIHGFITIICCLIPLWMIAKCFVEWSVSGADIAASWYDMVDKGNMMIEHGASMVGMSACSFDPPVCKWRRCPDPVCHPRPILTYILIGLALLLPELWTRHPTPPPDPDAATAKEEAVGTSTAGSSDESACGRRLTLIVGAGTAVSFVVVYLMICFNPPPQPPAIPGKMLTTTLEVLTMDTLMSTLASNALAITIVALTSVHLVRKYESGGLPVNAYSILLYTSSLAEDLFALKFTNGETHHSGELLLAFTFFPIVGALMSAVATCVPGGLDDMLVTTLFEMLQTLLYSYYADFSAEACVIYAILLTFQLTLIPLASASDWSGGDVLSLKQGFWAFVKDNSESISLALALGSLQIIWNMMGVGYVPTEIDIFFTIMLWRMGLGVVAPSLVRFFGDGRGSQILVYAAHWLMTACIVSSDIGKLMAGDMDGKLAYIFFIILICAISSAFWGYNSFNGTNLFARLEVEGVGGFLNDIEPSTKGLAAFKTSHADGQENLIIWHGDRIAWGKKMKAAWSWGNIYLQNPSNVHVEGIIMEVSDGGLDGIVRIGQTLPKGVFAAREFTNVIDFPNPELKWRTTGQVWAVRYMIVLSCVVVMGLWSYWVDFKLQLSWDDKGAGSPAMKAADSAAKATGAKSKLGAATKAAKAVGK